jgi:CHAD domain-containing protein
VTVSPAASAPRANARPRGEALERTRTSPALDETSPCLADRAAPYRASFMAMQVLGSKHTVNDACSATGDELAVHDLRVAIRRTRTLLEIGREVFGSLSLRAKSVRALTELQRATGALRDEEVLLQIVSSLPLHTTDLSAWVAVRRRREARLRTEVRRLVRRDGLAKGRALLAALLTFQVKASRDKRLVKFARRAVESAQREVERRRIASDHARALHRLRVSYKRLRYTTDTFADVLPPELGSPVARTAAGFQKRIGDVHDVDVVIASVRHSRSLPDPARQALLAALSHLRAEREATLLKDLGWGDRKPPPRVHFSGTDSLRKISTR